MLVFIQPTTVDNEPKIIHIKFVWLSFPYEILLKYFFNLLFVKKITNI